MPPPTLSVRDLREQDIPRIADYWTNADPTFLVGMGVDLAKVPARESLLASLHEQLRTPIEKKPAYCLIWEVDGEAVGNCNTNPTVFGDHAFMHLHMWSAARRQKGTGAELVRMTLPLLFDNLKLRWLCSQPYAQNLAPNKTLAKVGFEMVREYVTIPGRLAFEQPVKRWEMTRAQLDALLAARA